MKLFTYDKTSNSLKDTSDRELLMEIQRREYDLSRRRDLDETQTRTGEIVKIG